ncbi:hypothetical protein H6G35_25675 [Aulosira sp. FACHB-113]|uniref:hypothetical protein n=1 Tax=Tolypothrix tenuis TaxID=457083 RepID=UPI001684B240|nr:hypothetical protein [Aulosira sp. FACHB-113]
MSYQRILSSTGGSAVLICSIIKETFSIYQSNLQNLCAIAHLLFLVHWKSAGNSIPLWVERDSRPPTWGIGHWALGTLTHAQFPIPHALKLHPLVGGVFH